MAAEQEYPLNKVSFVLETSTKEKQLVNREDAIRNPKQTAWFSCSCE